MKGRLIVFEGIDGCGKTTQARLLAARLKAQGREVVDVREPGGTTLGERVRDLLLHSKETGISSRAEMLLYMASRAQLVDEVFLPALGRGRIIVSDRYYYSTAAYQGAGGTVGVSAILDLAERIARFPRPDLAILLDLPARRALTRIPGPKDRMESKGSSYLERARRAFRAIARQSPGRFLVLPADQPIDVLADRIRDRVRRILR